jgi:hypothetical protein
MAHGHDGGQSLSAEISDWVSNEVLARDEFGMTITVSVPSHWR